MTIKPITGFTLQALALALALTLLPACDGGGSGGGGKYAGYYEGTFGGDDFGIWSVGVDADGVAGGTAYSQRERVTYVLSGDVNGSGNLKTGMYKSGMHVGEFDGTIDTNGVVTGVWSHPGAGYEGEFIGARK